MANFDWGKYEEKPSQSSKSFNWKDYEEQESSVPKIHGKGWNAVLDDVLSGLSNVPDELGQAITSLPENVYSGGKQVVNDPLRAVLNLGGGVRQGLEGAINTPSNIASYLKSKDIGRGKVEDILTKMRIPESDLEQSLLGKVQPGDEFLRGLGSFAPYGIVGGAERGLSGLAKRAGATSAYAAGQQQNPLTSALMGLLGEGAVKGIQRATRPGNFLPSSPLSNEELRASVNLTKGTETGLGDVIENPLLKRQLENILPDIYGSGANQAAQRTASTIKNSGENILNEMKGEYDGNDFGQVLTNALKSSESEARANKTEKFKALNNAAEEAGIKTDRSNLRKTANSHLKKIISDPDLKNFVNPSIVSLLDKFSNSEGNINKNDIRSLEKFTPETPYTDVITGEQKTAIPPKYQYSSSSPSLPLKQTANVITGKYPKKEFSLQNTDYLRGHLGDAAQDAYMANDQYLSNIYRDLKKAADKDISESIDKSDNKKLHKLRDEAFDYYKEHYVPFEDKQIMKFTKEGADTDTLTNAFIKTSKVSDRANLLTKLASKLSPEERNVLSYSYFSRAIKDGELNPLTLKTLYKSLGERQKKALLPESMIKKLSDYSKLVQKNTDPLNIMFNQKTGARVPSFLGQSLPAIGTGIGALATGSVPFSILSAAIPSLLARPAVKVLTNPDLRERIVNSMIKARAKGKTPPMNLSPFINALIQGSQTKNKPMELELNKFAGYQGQGEK